MIPKRSNLFLYPQLPRALWPSGFVWASYSCWVADACSAGTWASDVPGHEPVIFDMLAMRRRTSQFSPNPTPKQLADLGPGNLTDERDALRHPDTAAAFRAAGLHPPKVRVLGVTTPRVVRGHLLAGDSVSMSVGYAVLNDRRPQASGSPTFNDGHAVRFQGIFHRDGALAKPGDRLNGPKDRWFTDLVDPLADGRRQGIAKGPQRIPLALAFAMAAAVPINDAGDVLGKGRVLAMAVSKAKPLAKPKPTPDPIPHPDPTDPCLVRITAEVRPLQEALAATKAEVDRISGSALAENERLRGVIRTMAAAVLDGANEIAQQAAEAEVDA